MGGDTSPGTTGFDVVDSQGWSRAEVPGGLVKHPENQYVRTLTSTPSPLSQWLSREVSAPACRPRGCSGIRMPTHPGRPASAKPGTSSGGWSRGNPPARRPRDETQSAGYARRRHLWTIADVGSIPTVSTPTVRRFGFRIGDRGVFLVVEPAATARLPASAVAGGAAVAKRDEQIAQLGALVGAQAGEDRVLGLALGLGRAVELALALGREGDDVAAAVGRVAVAGDQAVRFERVEHRHEDARVGGHGPAQLALAHRSLVGEEAE